MTLAPIPIDIVFDGMDASDALRARIERRARQLARFARDVADCHVTVRACERHHRRGNRYNVHARVTLHGHTIEAGQTPTPDLSHDDPYVAVTHTFDSLRRRIEDHVRRRRGDVKAHALE